MLAVRSSREVLGYATSTKRGPKPRGIIAGSQADDARPMWVADGVLHGAPQGAARTLCGLSTEGMHLFADHNFESVTIASGLLSGLRRCGPRLWRGLVALR